MADLKYKPCNHCADAREQPEIRTSARGCNWCFGTGLRLESYVCNCCGETIATERGVTGLPELKIYGSYGSLHLLDMTRYAFSICERCLRELFERMAVPPDVSDEMARPVDAEPYTYQRDRELYLEMLLRHGDRP